MSSGKHAERPDFTRGIATSDNVCYVARRDNRYPTDSVLDNAESVAYTVREGFFRKGRRW